MSIKFSCPHCHKAFNVKDELAGKRSRCPGCKQVLTIPIPIWQGPDLEAMAAAALADEPAPAPAAAAAAAPQSTATIEFNCYYCDTKVQVSADLAGKQSPCPECRRIIKVPLLEKKDPTDWRKVDTKLPAGARRDTEPAPEGAWSTRSVTTVSREALVEAEAIPEVRPRLTWQQWTKRSVLLAAFLGVLGVGTLIALHYLRRERQVQAFDQALQSAEAPDRIGYETAAEIYRAAGEYTLRTGKAKDALAHLERARDAMSKAKQASPNEQDAFLVDVALGELSLGGEKPEVDAGTRLKWDTALKEAGRTLQTLHSEEVRTEATRKIAQWLIARGMSDRIAPLLSSFPATERPGLLALVGLELLRGNPEEKALALAQKLAQQAQDGLPKTPAPKQGQAKPKTVPPPAAVLALWLALGNGDKATALAPIPQDDKNLNVGVLAGYVEGLARHGELAAAQQLLAKVGRAPVHSLPGLVALAGAALDKDQAGLARPMLEEALGLAVDPATAKAVSPWLLLWLIRLSVQAGLDAQRLQTAANAIPDLALRGRAQLEIIRNQLAANPATAEESIVQPIPSETLAHGLGREELARHNVRAGSAEIAKRVSSWEPEKVRALGNIGVALGEQDRNQ
jgi:hypothetical protein